MGKYNIYEGKFACHTCKLECKTLRHYPSTQKITWMCADKHLSEVSLNTKKTKEAYEREG